MSAPRSKTAIGIGTYTGQTDLSRRPQGSGLAQWRYRDQGIDGAAGPIVQYSGAWVRKQRQGKGTSSVITGTTFQGEYKADKKHGFGRENFNYGASYVGDFKNGRATGAGTAVGVDGAQYTGDVVDGLWHGKGILVMQNGSRYEGDYAKGLREGTGHFEWNDGEVYDGEYVADARHGKGTYTWPDGRKYVGDFQNEQRHGRGEFTWPSGNRFVGQYERDRRHGPGSLCYASGQVDAGDWQGGYLKRIALSSGDASGNPGPLTIKGYELITAVKSDALQIIRNLLDSGHVSVDIMDSTGHSSLFYAASNGSVEAIKILLEHGAHVNLLTDNTAIVVSTYATSCQRKTPASLAGKLRETSFLLLKHGAQPDLGTAQDSMLRTAILANDVEMVHELLNRCIDLTRRHTRMNRTLLLEAGQEWAKYRRQAKVLEVWQSNAQRGSKIKGDNAFQIVMAILNAGAAADDIDSQGLSLLHIVAGVHESEALSVFSIAIHGGDTNNPNCSNVNQVWKGTTPLSIALGCGNDVLAKQLFELNADPNIQLRNGKFVLSELVSVRMRELRTPKERRNLFSVLLKYDADPLALMTLERWDGEEQEGLIIDQMFCDLKNEKTSTKTSTSMAAGHDHRLCEILLSAMRARHLQLGKAGHEVISFCYGCGRRAGLHLNRFRTTPAVHFCSDKCELRAISQGRLKWFRGLGIDGLGAVRWQGNEASASKEMPIADQPPLKSYAGEAQLMSEGSTVIPMQLTGADKTQNL